MRGSVCLSASCLPCPRFRRLDTQPVHSFYHHNNRCYHQNQSRHPRNQRTKAILCFLLRRKMVLPSMSLLLIGHCCLQCRGCSMFPNPLLDQKRRMLSVYTAVASCCLRLSGIKIK